jgi:hypothetical protein
MSDTYFVIDLGNRINAKAIFTCRPCRRGASVVATVPERRYSIDNYITKEMETTWLDLCDGV